MEKQILDVTKFQEAFGIQTPKQPKMLSKKRKLLRQRLLEEEVKELWESKNILDVADAICDIMYIAIGTAQEYGLSDRLVMLFDEVHSSNMSKLGPDGKALFREDGKILKPESYREPKLRPIIERDFSIYKESDVMKEIADIEKKATTNKIQKKISKHLNIFDRLLFWIYDKIEQRLAKRVEVKFPVSIHDDIVVSVYKKDHIV
jgi:predicted HAD superfamily Cof-like phosphohydrolase